MILKRAASRTSEWQSQTLVRHVATDLGLREAHESSLSSR